MTRPTNAIVLGSIKGGVPLARRIVRRERVKRRQADAVLPIVADEAAIVRRILLPEGTDVRAGDPLALLTDDESVPLALSPADAATFRASIRTDDPMIEVLL
jgi:multidrug efflux pump subunit AcrA (membrane-fusion protein)